MKILRITIFFLHLSFIGSAQPFLRTELPLTLNTPWEIQYGPDDHLWLSEYGGIISRVDPVTGTKNVVYTASDYYPGSPLEQMILCPNHPIGEGTFGLALDPDFATTNPAFIYLVYSYNEGNDSVPDTRFKIGRITWDKTTETVTGDTTIVNNLSNGYDHFGGRLLAVKRNGINYLFYSAGDNGISEDNAPTCYNPQSSNPNNFAQDPFTLNGKIHRFLTDGSIPIDNPIPGYSFYTRGHRNPQGLIYNKSNDVLYDIEHGDRTDDEINILYPGMNYGWKSVRGYHGDSNYPGEDSIIANYVPHPLIADDSLVQAFYSWCDTTQPPATPVTPAAWCTVAPSDGVHYTSTVIPDMTNSLLVTTLKNGNTVTHELYCFHLTSDGKGLMPSTPAQPNPTIYFAGDEALNGRLRDIAISPDSSKIYLINNGGTTADKIIVYSLMNVNTAENSALANSIIISPVPAHDHIRIQTKFIWKKLRVFSISGQLVREINGPQETLDVSELNSGAFLLSFESTEGRRVYKNIIIW